MVDVVSKSGKEKEIMDSVKGEKKNGKRGNVLNDSPKIMTGIVQSDTNDTISSKSKPDASYRFQ